MIDHIKWLYRLMFLLYRWNIRAFAERLDDWLITREKKIIKALRKL